MIRLIFIFSIYLFIFSCKNEKTAEVKTPPVATNTAQQKTSAQPTPQPQLQASGKELYPSVPTSLIKSLSERSDYIDFSFHNMPFTMHQQELRDIQGSLMHISSQPALVNHACQEIGRALFYRDAEIALEAAIHYSEAGCSYFIFHENGKPKYANFMTARGIKFYKDILGKFKQ